MLLVNAGLRITHIIASGRAGAIVEAQHEQQCKYVPVRAPPLSKTLVVEKGVRRTDFVTL
jgi:hypothetical protein